MATDDKTVQVISKQIHSIVDVSPLSYHDIVEMLAKLYEHYRQHPMFEAEQAQCLYKVDD